MLLIQIGRMRGSFYHAKSLGFLPTLKGILKNSTFKRIKETVLGPVNASCDNPDRHEQKSEPVEPEKLLQHYKESFDLAISNKEEAPEGVTLDSGKNCLHQGFFYESSILFFYFKELLLNRHHTI